MCKVKELDFILPASPSLHFMREGLDDQMMRLGEGKRVGSKRIEGRGQVLNIAPVQTRTSWSQPASGLQGRCWSPHVLLGFWVEERLRSQAKRKICLVQ